MSGRKHSFELKFSGHSTKPPPSLEGPPVLQGPLQIEGPSGVEILENCPTGVGRFFHENIAMCETIIEGPGPFIAGRGLGSKHSKTKHK